MIHPQPELSAAALRNSPRRIPEQVSPAQTPAQELLRQIRQNWCALTARLRFLGLDSLVEDEIDKFDNLLFPK